MNATIQSKDDRLTDFKNSKSSVLWRKLWRLHFLAGLIIAPALVWLALTGLVVLYSDVISSKTHQDLYFVTNNKNAEPISLDRQLENVETKFPELTFWSATPSREPNRSNMFSMGDKNDAPYNVFVNQYTGVVLGKIRSDKGIVAFANNTHGSFVPRQFTMLIPSPTGIIGEGPAFRSVEIGEVIVEIIAGWGLVLAISGMYLWLPRKSSKKRLIVPRFRQGGRAMWRDMHASAGTFLAAGLIFLVVTGLPWATFWGNEFSTIADRITPNAGDSFSWEDQGPASVLPRIGDLTRYGVKIPWAATKDAIPSSDGGMVHSHSSVDEAKSDDHHDMAHQHDTSGAPALSVGLDTAYKAALEEGMSPGFSITPPSDSMNDDGSKRFGAYVVVNPWPSSLGEQGALFLDQFSGKTLGRSSADGWGVIQRTAELGVQTHMGTQFGLINRVVLTLLCVTVFYSITTAIVMWLRRRRKGSLGVPPRQVDVSSQKSMSVVALVLAVIYPLWWTSALLLLFVDHFLQRKIGVVTSSEILV